MESEEEEEGVESEEEVKGVESEEEEEVKGWSQRRRRR